MTVFVFPLRLVLIFSMGWTFNSKADQGTAFPRADHGFLEGHRTYSEPDGRPFTAGRHAAFPARLGLPNLGMLLLQPSGHLVEGAC